MHALGAGAYLDQLRFSWRQAVPSVSCTLWQNTLLSSGALEEWCLITKEWIAKKINITYIDWVYIDHIKCFFILEFKSYGSCHPLGTIIYRNNYILRIIDFLSLGGKLSCLQGQAGNTDERLWPGVRPEGVVQTVVVWRPQASSRFCFEELLRSKTNHTQTEFNPKHSRLPALVYCFSFCSGKWNLDWTSNFSSRSQKYLFNTNLALGF